MRFEERELNPYAEPISATDLEEGQVYFAVNYVDDDLLIPTLETVVFVGKNLVPTEPGKVYFQDIDSYLEGVRYDSVSENDHAVFSCGAETELKHIFKYEKALDELMRCALRCRKPNSAVSMAGSF
jgi:hypothetical protein